MNAYVICFKYLSLQDNKHPLLRRINQSLPLPKNERTIRGPHSVQALHLSLSRFEKGSAEPTTSLPPRSKYQHTDPRSHASERTQYESIGRIATGRRQGRRDSPEKEGTRT